MRSGKGQAVLENKHLKAARSSDSAIVSWWIRNGQEIVDPAGPRCFRFIEEDDSGDDLRVVGNYRKVININDAVSPLRKSETKKGF